MATELRGELADAGTAAVVLAGPRLLQSRGAARAVADLAAELNARFTLLCRRSNDRGALRAGLHPSLLPGGRRVDIDQERRALEDIWGAGIPAEPGRDTAAILAAAARREIEVLFLVGTDPMRDFPDATLVHHALENVRSKVVVDVSADAMAIYADAMLPAVPYLEKDGHYTDWEGRAQRLRPVRAPLGLARSEWEIFQELSEVAGADMGFHSLDALHEEMGRLLAGDAAPAEVGTAPRGQPPPSPALRDPSPSAAEPAAQSTRTPTQGDQLILFTYPLLVDEGRLSAGADLLKSALEEQPLVEVNTADAARLEIVDGQAVRLRTQAGEATLPARVRDGVAAGAVFVPWNQPGFAANTILSGGAVTTVTLEPAAAEVSA